MIKFYAGKLFLTGNSRRPACAEQGADIGDSQVQPAKNQDNRHDPYNKRCHLFYPVAKG